MKISITVKLEELGPRMMARARAFPVAAQKGLLSGAMRCLPLIQDATRDAPPANPQGIGVGGAVNTGNYLQSWRVTPIPGGVSLHNIAPYSGVIEFGRRRGKFPPLNAIAKWAQRRLGLDEKEAKRAAYPIALAIKRRGLEPRRVASDKVEQMAAIVLEETRNMIMKAMAHP